MDIGIDMDINIDTVLSRAHTHNHTLSAGFMYQCNKQYTFTAYH